MEQSDRLRAIAQGALLAAVAVVLFLISIFIPPLRLLTGFLCPTPIIIMQARVRSVPYTLMMILVAGVLITGFAGYFAALAFVLFVGSVGLALGWGISKGFEAGTSIALGTSALVIVYGLAFTLTGGFAGTDMFFEKMKKEYVRQMEDAKNDALADVEKRGGDKSERELVEAQYNMLITALKRSEDFLLGGFIVAGAITVTLNYWAAHMVMSKLRLPVKAIGPFTHFSLHWATIWGLIAAIVLTSLGAGETPEENTFLFTAGANLAVIMFFLFFVQGLALVHYYFQRVKMPVLIRIALYASIVIVKDLLLLLVILGVADLYYDFRKLEPAVAGGSGTQAGEKKSDDEHGSGER